MMRSPTWNGASKKYLGCVSFEDTDGKMNLPIGEKMGILVVSQFTLHGNLKKGFRPSFNRAAPLPWQFPFIIVLLKCLKILLPEMCKPVNLAPT